LLLGVVNANFLASTWEVGVVDLATHLLLRHGGRLLLWNDTVPQWAGHNRKLEIGGGRVVPTAGGLATRPISGAEQNLPASSLLCLLACSERRRVASLDWIWRLVWMHILAATGSERILARSSRAWRWAYSEDIGQARASDCDCAGDGGWVGGCSQEVTEEEMGIWCWWALVGTAVD
jgi:hypothetical protein